MSKSKLSLEDSITLAQNNAIDFTHACVTIALNEKFGIGKERQKKVNAVRDEVNGKVLEIMIRPASRKHEPLRKAEAWMHSQMPEGTVWELHIPMAKGRARSHKEWKMQGAVDSAATLEWRVCAIACAEVLDRPDQKEIWGYRMHEEQAMREMRTRQVRNEVRRMCAPKALPLAPAEVEKRIQTALQYGTPDSWQRRRTR